MLFFWVLEQNTFSSKMLEAFYFKERIRFPQNFILREFVHHIIEHHNVINLLLY